PFSRVSHEALCAGSARRTAAAPSIVNAIVRGEVSVAQCGSAVSYQRLAQARMSASGAFSKVWPSAQIARPFESSEPQSSHHVRSKFMKLRSASFSSFQACWTKEAYVRLQLARS